MLSKAQIDKIKPAPFEPVFRKRIVMVNGNPKTILIPVMVYDPVTRKKVQKMQRGSYTNTQLNKAFPDQKRNKKIEELLAA